MKRTSRWATHLVVFLGALTPSLSQTLTLNSRPEYVPAHETAPLRAPAGHANVPPPEAATRTPRSTRDLPYRDNTPLVTADGRLMFFNSTRGDGRSWARLSHDSSRFDDDIYFRSLKSVVGGEETWGEAVNLGAAVNTSRDDGISAINPGGTRMYVVSMRDGWEDDGGPFYTVDVSGISVGGVKSMGGGIARFFRIRNRSLDFKIYGASVDAYEKTFYFATDLHTNSHRLEIWVSHLVDGAWEYPVNLGPTVNSAGGSYAPFIAADGRTLYFASSRPGGYGGDDIYRVVLDSNSVPSMAENLGPTINTAASEAFLSIPASGDRIYFSRDDGGIESIVSTPVPLGLRPGGVAILSGRVIDRATRQPVAAMVRIEHLETDSLVYEGSTSEFEDRYSAVLRPGSTYGISVSAPGYVFTSTAYAISDTIRYTELSHDFELERIAPNRSFTLHNIFFEYNSAELSTESTLELERLATMMKVRPEIRIEVGGHTDNIGGPAFNADLSERRARSVVDYLERTSGISRDRMVARGFGATQPVKENDTEDGRAANRRVAFTITSM